MSQGGRTPKMRLQLLHQNVRRDFENNVGNKKDRQRGVVFRARLDIQVFL